jgi:hypothetical protein
MLIRFGRRFELEVHLGMLYLDAPLVGKVFLGPGGCHWNR